MWQWELLALAPDPFEVRAVYEQVVSVVDPIEQFDVERAVAQEEREETKSGSYVRRKVCHEIIIHEVEPASGPRDGVDGGFREDPQEGVDRGRERWGSVDDGVHEAVVVR